MLDNFYSENHVAKQTGSDKSRGRPSAGLRGAERGDALIRKPYLLFLGDVRSDIFAKTAFGLRDWCPDDVIGQWRLPGCTVDLGLPDLDPERAYARGARSMVVAVAPIGGAIPPGWHAALLAALDAGLDLVSGMHGRLRDIPAVAERVARTGRAVHDVRHYDQPLPIATGRRRTGKRLATVGTDCSVGKKYTAIAIARELARRGVPSDFRATGQTGIMIAGGGIAIDAVIGDFIAGAAEQLSPDAAPDHWDVIEGQGSIFHPAYAGVTLGLLHGSQPDALVLCHDASRPTINGYPDFPIVSYAEAITAYERLARLTNPDARVIGISINTSRLDPDARAEALAVAAATGLAVGDPIATGMAPIVDRMLAPC